MLTIINETAETIGVSYSDENIVIEGKTEASIYKKLDCLKIEHLTFLKRNIPIDNIINSIAKSSVLIIDSIIYFTQICTNATLIIKNATYEYETGDFGYLFFEILAKDCICELINCTIINKESVLRTQKVLRIGECYDFPPFSTINAIIKYHKIKKACSHNSVLKFLKSYKTIKIQPTKDGSMID